MRVLFVGEGRYYWRLKENAGSSAPAEIQFRLFVLLDQFGLALLVAEHFIEQEKSEADQDGNGTK